MQLTTFALSALSIGSALAATTVHVVKVGNANKTLTFSPDSITAAKGDMVQFQFAPANHTVTQSTFDQPCQPIAANSNVTGIYSGFMPVAATATEIPTYTIMVNSTTPIWLYCSQGKHCQAGMVMVINVNPTANASHTLEAFKALAAKATVNLPGGSTANGTAGEVPTASASGTGTGTGTSTDSTPSAASSGAAASIKAPEALTLGGLLSLGAALFL